MLFNFDYCVSSLWMLPVESLDVCKLTFLHEWFSPAIVPSIPETYLISKQLYMVASSNIAKWTASNSLMVLVLAITLFCCLYEPLPLDVRNRDVKLVLGAML